MGSPFKTVIKYALIVQAALFLMPAVSHAEIKNVVILKTLSNHSMDARAERFQFELRQLAAQLSIKLTLTVFDTEGNSSLTEDYIENRVLAEDIDILVPMATKAPAAAWKYREQLAKNNVDTFFILMS